MKFWPSVNLSFRLLDDQNTTLDRLKRRTEFSKLLASSPTEKSFRGKINGNQFRIISSEIPKGPLCVLDGEILEEQGRVKVEVNSAFKIIFGIVLCFPVIATLIEIFSENGEFSFALIPITLLGILVIRFVILGYLFKIESRKSLSRLRDVLDAEFLTN